jgi:hypothetical protein
LLILNMTEQDWSDKVGEFCCPVLLPEEETLARLAKLLEPRSADAAPFKGQMKRKSNRGVRIHEPWLPASSHISSGKEETSAVVAEEEEEEEESSSDRVDSEVPDGQASKPPQRPQKWPSRHSAAGSSDSSATDIIFPSSPKRVKPAPYS